MREQETNSNTRFLGTLEANKFANDRLPRLMTEIFFCSTVNISLLHRMWYINNFFPGRRTVAPGRQSRRQTMLRHFAIPFAATAALLFATTPMARAGSAAEPAQARIALTDTQMDGVVAGKPELQTLGTSENSCNSGQCFYTNNGKVIGKPVKGFNN
jgi:hypothetical protein